MIIVIIIIIFLLFIYFIKSKIEENFEQKIIVSVFSDQYGLGLGDYMRGIIFLHKNCDTCKIYADYSQHKISTFLTNLAIKPTYNESQIDRIWRKQEVDNLNKDINLVFCNSEFSGNVSPEIKESLKKSFTMKEDFKNYFDNIFNSLHLDNNFIVLHIRLDDKYFYQSPPEYTMLDEFINNTIIPNYGNNVLVMSNSLEMKNRIANKYNFKQFVNKPVHTTAENSSVEELRDTLVEFFILSKAKKIYQFSEYLHSSGFSKRISEIYDIELEKFLLK